MKKFHSPAAFALAFSSSMHRDHLPAIALVRLRGDNRPVAGRIFVIDEGLHAIAEIGLALAQREVHRILSWLVDRGLRPYRDFGKARFAPRNRSLRAAEKTLSLRKEAVKLGRMQAGRMKCGRRTRSRDQALPGEARCDPRRRRRSDQRTKREGHDLRRCRAPRRPQHHQRDLLFQAQGRPRRRRVSSIRSTGSRRCSTRPRPSRRREARVARYLALNMERLARIAAWRGAGRCACCPISARWRSRCAAGCWRAGATSSARPAACGAPAANRAETDLHGARAHVLLENTFWLTDLAGPLRTGSVRPRSRRG